MGLTKTADSLATFASAWRLNPLYLAHLDNLWLPRRGVLVQERELTANLILLSEGEFRMTKRAAGGLLAERYAKPGASWNLWRTSVVALLPYPGTLSAATDSFLYVETGQSGTGERLGHGFVWHIVSRSTDMAGQSKPAHVRPKQCSA